MYKADKYFWWNDAQKQLAYEVAVYSDDLIAPRIQEIEDTKRFPWEILEEIGKKGWYGVLETIGVTEKDLEDHLIDLEMEKMVAVHRSRGRTALIKSTYDGLRKANPPEYYRKFPAFVDMEREVF